MKEYYFGDDAEESVVDSFMERNDNSTGKLLFLKIFNWRVKKKVITQPISGNVSLNFNTTSDNEIKIKIPFAIENGVVTVQDANSDVEA